ncbi:MAG: MarR family transcriptional regulator [Clostridia bacterium]|nr:MarR family transcriptional regulator [Clostridia bacterium]
MDYRWMGRYRALVSALARHVNTIDKIKANFQTEISDGVYIDHLTWQIMEYFIEHHSNTCNMIDIAARLGIPQSSFSKKVKLLKQYGFIERFHAEGNKKEIIVRPTDRAMQFYTQNTADNVRKLFQPFFDKLEGFSDEQIAAMAEALNTLTDTCEAKGTEPDKVRLVPVENA